jgi:hypothetical protein
MKISKFKEHKDGSATCMVDMTLAEKQAVLEEGLISMIKKSIEYLKLECPDGTKHLEELKEKGEK